MPWKKRQEMYLQDTLRTRISLEPVIWILQIKYSGNLPKSFIWSFTKKSYYHVLYILFYQKSLKNLPNILVRNFGRQGVT